jgi:hypothetical protein
VTRTALFLGAGFSAWAAQLPVVSGLFDLAISIHGPREASRLDRVARIKDEWDRRNPRAGNERFVAYALTLADPERDLVLWYVARRLSDPFIWYAGRRRYPYPIDDANRDRHPGVRAAASFLQPFWNWEISGAVTTNYDLLVEFAVGSRLFNYGMVGEQLLGRGRWQGLGGPVSLFGHVPVAKLHGSISWGMDGTKYAEGRRGLTGGSLIVAPVPEKTPPPQLASVWALAERILRGADRLLVFGFAFNPYDEAVLNLLRAGGTGLRDVLVVNRSDVTPQAKALWPRAHIQWSGPPPGGATAIGAWTAA